MQTLENEIKQLIIDALNLEELTPEDIETTAPLFNDGLGLDSIDALELGLAIKNKFQVELNADSEEVHQYFYSVKTLAEFIQSQQA
ncbi:phosphopantetheine-binding protein [Testudinibacter sp. TR-2022]|uniref:phosphopantetheine-binding protein n=1 Tax=Testudinibacter sp. TR-2022 TaxID=2585029 RepID=UPI00111B9D04|nr:phosphopantetheine-binding protein [Testudinibacter sp. TR-2022]TNH06003.1 acyl carrier protein [Pasteurellaceae bacterium Phil11]TNH24296.1 acyl carrier protein [Testudinibacter sp. TR-2022]TNH26887.1 acyl carrier protein [Testudinibacter sp. TR-2022]